MWAQSPDLNPKTTNSAEAFHSHLNNDIHTPHPNIYIFVQSKTILRQQTAYISIGSLAFTRTVPRAIREKSARVTVINGISTGYINIDTVSETNGISCGTTLIIVYPW